MNQAQVVNLIQTIGKVAGASLAAHGATLQQVSYVQLVCGIFIAVVSWWFSHLSNDDGSTPPNNPVTKIPLMLLALVIAFGGAGCIQTAIQHGNIVEYDNTVFGFNCTAINSTTASPAVQFGLIRSKLLYIPTQTNGSIASPNYGSTGNLNNNGKSLFFGGSDSTATGSNGTILTDTNTSITP
jgi:hypothetical protein